MRRKTPRAQPATAEPAPVKASASGSEAVTMTRNTVVTPGAEDPEIARAPTKGARRVVKPRVMRTPSTPGDYVTEDNPEGWEVYDGEAQIVKPNPTNPSEAHPCPKCGSDLVLTEVQRVGARIVTHRFRCEGSGCGLLVTAPTSRVRI